MDVIIVLIVSSIGAYFCDLDFCTLHTFVSIVVALAKECEKYTNDKFTRR